MNMNDVNRLATALRARGAQVVSAVLSDGAARLECSWGIPNVCLLPPSGDGRNDSARLYAHRDHAHEWAYRPVATRWEYHADGRPFRKSAPKRLTEALQEIAA